METGSSKILIPTLLDARGGGCRNGRFMHWRNQAERKEVSVGGGRVDGLQWNIRSCWLENHVNEIHWQSNTENSMPPCCGCLCRPPLEPPPLCLFSSSHVLLFFSVSIFRLVSSSQSTVFSLDPHSGESGCFWPNSVKNTDKRFHLLTPHISHSLLPEGLQVGWTTC